MGLKIATYNNTALSATMTLESTGDGSGVSTLRMTSLVDTTLTLTGSARFYTDAAGTTGESTSWTIVAGALRTIYLKAPSGSSTLTIPNRFVISQLGNSASDGWASGTNAARLVFTCIDLQNLTSLRIAGTSTLTGALPTGLTYLRLVGNSIAWTYSGALPTGLTYLYLGGNSIAWTYNGALPIRLTYLYLGGGSIAWTYNGALPTGLNNLYLAGDSIAWTYNGALPTGLNNSYLLGNLIAWTYNGALPIGLTYLYLGGGSIDYTGANVSGTANITTFTMSNFRISKMTDAELITLLQSMTNRVGGLPAAAIIGDIANPTSTDAGVLAALSALQAAKGTVVTRQA